MFSLILNKVSHGINLAQFTIGDMIFPLLEPFCRLFENRNPTARKHFQQALESLENQNFSVALLNLNMVVNIYPNHFLARVYRARFFFHQKRFKLAVEDYFLASQISRYRFIHYDLYREYFYSMNQGFGNMDAPLNKNFNPAYQLRGLNRYPSPENLDLDSQILETGVIRNASHNIDGSYPIENYFLISKERITSSDLGPITKKEIETTDWDILIKELSSKIR